jgi:hypothetical protein
MVMRKLLCLFISAVTIFPLVAQNYPVYGPEVKVFIAGWSTDAMEPFISPDGSTLFFNSLNSGGDTRLHYAIRIDDSTFTYVGEVTGANEPANPQLNAVPSLDTTGNFVWVSARSWPAEMDNLHRADYLNGVCTNVNRVHGNFYVYQTGYIVMDAAVTYDGAQLFYCNAFFDTCVVPCTASLGIAARVNDSTFNTIANSSGILQNVNDPAYCVYAPQLSANGLELYFTRFLIGGLSTEICVSVRNSPTDTFSIPQVLITEFPNVPEAASVNTAMTLMYYHKKINGTYAIHLRQRIATGIEEQNDHAALRVFPNPASDVLILPETQERIEIRNATGQLVITDANSAVVNIAELPEGMYSVHTLLSGITSSATFIICR